MITPTEIVTYATSTTATGPQGHHRFSPSTLNDRAVCPGWDKDEGGDTTRADEGTRLHAVCQTRDFTGLDDEQKQAVGLCLRYIDALLPRASVKMEERNLQILAGRTSGTADLIVVVGDTVHVIDYKFGKNEVKDADINLQGWAYLSGAWDLFPTAKFGMVHFLMPRVAHGSELGVVFKHKFDRKKDEPRMKLAIATVLDRAEKFFATKDPSMLNPTAEGCLYCGRKAECPALWAYALPVAKKYSPLEIVDEVHSSQITDPVKMVALIEAAKILGKLADSVTEHARAFALQHGGINGADGQPAYVLGQRSGTRKLRPEKVADAVDALLEKGFTDRDLLACSELSITKVLELAGERAPRGKKTAVRAAIETKLEEIGAVTTGEPTMFLKKVKKEVDQPVLLDHTSSTPVSG